MHPTLIAFIIALATFFFALIWYGALFDQPFGKALPHLKKGVTRENVTRMIESFLLMFLGANILVLVISEAAVTISDAMRYGLMLWTLLVCMEMVNNLFTTTPKVIQLINGVFWLIAVSGASGMIMWLS